MRASALPSWCVPLLALVCFALPQVVWAQNAPGKPTITALVPKGGCFTVRWTAPDDDGGSAITGYDITPQNSSTYVKEVGANIRETQWPLSCYTNETLTYNMAVRATNANGDGAWSDTVNSTVALPVLTADTAANAPDVTLSITQMAKAPWYYKGTQAGATCTSVAKGTASATVTGLTVGTEYTYGAYYDSNCSEKWGQDRTVTVKFTPVAAKPGKPTNVTVTGGDASVTLGWTSGGDGGSEITKWQYKKKTGDDWDSTWTDICETSSDSNCPSKTSHTVSSLNNGTTYKFKVRAVNAVDDGAESDESASVTLVGKPPKPTSVTVTGGNASVTLGWTSGGNGGSAITKWQYLKEEGGTWDSTWTDICETSTNSNCPSVASHTVSNLTNGTAYKFKVRAVNTHGDGTESDESASATPATKPPKPTSVTVTGGDASVTLGWTSGGNGGSAITKWQYLKEEGGTWDSTWTDICETASDSNCPSVASHTVSSLTNGTAYKFKVRAVNTHGDGAESDASASVTPEGKPPKPTNVTVSSGDQSVTLGWTSGGNGGSEIIKWQYLKEAGGTWDSTWTDICETETNRDCPSVTSHTVSSLNNGTAYKFKVRAVNAHGDGAESDESASVKPAGKPPKPTKPTVTAGHRNVKVSSSVSSNNGSGITKWQYKKKTGETWDSDWTDVPNSALTETMTVTVVGLTNGTTYRFKVQAVNGVGASDESDESDAATPKIYTFEVKDRTETTATLHLTGYPGPWYYKGGEGGSGACTAVSSGTTTVALASLKAGTSYTYTAHNTTNANCTSASRLGSALTFSTLDFRLESKTNTTADLELDYWPQGQAWSYRKVFPSSGTCNDTTATSVSVADLEENTSYSYRAFHGSGCPTGNLIGVVHFKTTPRHGIFANTVGQTTAKLRLDTGGADIPWWHQKTAGPGEATCVGIAAGTNTIDLSGLTAGQSYTWAAYRNEGCADNHKIDDVTFSTRAPLKPSKPQVTAGNAQVTLTSSVQTNGGPAITKWQYIKKEGANNWETDWKDISSSADSSLSTTITGLTNNKSYKFKVRARNSVGYSDESDESNAVTPKAPTLTASGVTHNTATLTLGDHSGNWWLKRTTPASTNCKSKGTTATESLSSLAGNTSYTYKAYSNSDCSTELAARTFLTKPAKPGKPTATAGSGSGKLTLTATLTGGSGALTKWEYTKDGGTNWTDITTDTDNSLSHVVTDLTDGTEYTFKVRATNATGTGPASDASTATAPVDEALTASDVEDDTATLTLSNHPGNWWLKRTTPASTNCKSKGTTATESLSSLTGNTSYTYKAYSNSDCSTELAARTFLTKPAKPGKPTATAGAGSGKLTLTATLTGGSGALTKWEYTKDDGANWTDITTDTDNSLSHVVADLTDGTEYTFKVRATNATGTGPASDASTAVAPVDETLTATDVEDDTATLTLANYSGNWWLKRTTPASTNCKSKGTTATESLSSLAGNTSYTYKAYSNSDCTTELAARTFLTRPAKPGKPTATAGAGSGKLTLTATLTGGTGALTKWEYTKDGGTNWTDITTDTDNSLSHVVTDLTDGTEYTFKVRATNATGTGPASDASTAAAPVDETLTAGSITHNTATLTLANYSGNWWLKRTTPADTNCKSKGTTATESLSSLAGNTSYTYKAYSNSDCSTELAARTFLTKPAKPGKPTATAGAGSGKLTLTATLTGGAGALTKWEYTKDGGTNWTDVTTDTDNNLSHVVTDLTDGTNYTFKVRATNATGTGPVSDASTAVAPLDETLTAGSVTHNAATLTLANYSGNWYWKEASGTCSTDAVSTTSVDLADLAGNTSYTYSAYSDSGCTSSKLLATASAFLTRPAKPGKPTATAGAGSGKLTLAATLTGGAGALTKWEYTKDDGANWTDITTDTDNSLSHVVTGLIDGTSYTFKVRATNATGTGPVSDASTAVAPLDETLAAGSVTHNTATLTLANHPGNWWLKRTTPASTTCKSKGTTATESLSSLTGNTSYTYKAYSNDTCTTELAARTFLTRPAKPGKPTATAGAGSGKLALTATLTGGAGALTKWEYTKDDGTTWTDITTDTANNLSYVVSGLTDGTNYTFKVRATNATGTGPASDASTEVAPTAPTLIATKAEVSRMELTIGNWSAKWHYKYTTPNGGQCSSSAVAAGVWAQSVSTLTANTAYTFKAYSDSGCTDELASATPYATLPPKPTTPTVAAGVGSGKLTLSSSATSGGDLVLDRWEYRKKEGSNAWEAGWTQISSTSTTLSHTVTGLDDDKDYRFRVRARNASGAGEESDASQAVAPEDETLTVDPSTITATGATLTIGNWQEKWYYKYTSPGGGSCSDQAVPAGTSTKAVTGLESNTSYTFKAYSDSTCDTELAAASAFPTLPPKPAKPTATDSVGSGKLDLSSSVSGGDVDLTKWQYTTDDGTSWKPIPNIKSKTLTYTVSNLTNGTSYTFKVRAWNASGAGEKSDASDSATPEDETLTAGTITATGATLTIGNWSAAWHYKYTSPSGGGCSTQAVPAGTPSKAVTGLESNTAYTFKAYSDGTCSTELAAATAFPTLPPKPATPTMLAGNTELTLSSSVSGGSAALTEWQYKRKEGNGNFDATWTRIDGKTSKTLSHTFTGLTNNTDYRYKVRALNASGAGEESGASQVMAPTDATLKVDNITTTGARLTIIDPPPNLTTWHYQYTSPDGGQCTSASGTTANVTGLEKGTTYTIEVYRNDTCSTSLGLTAIFTTLERDAPRVTPPPPVTVPPAPGKPEVMAGDGQVTLTWTSNGDGGSAITKWQYVKKAGDDAFETTWTDISDSGEDTTTHTVTDLGNGTTYRFKVRAVNANGEGAASPASDEVTPVAVTLAAVPPAPGRPTVAGGDGRVAVSWTSNGDGGSTITKWQYAKQVGADAFETTWTDIPGSGETTTTHTVTGLANGTVYRFRVRAVNAVGEGAASPESDAVTPAAAPPAPGRPVVTAGDGQVSLRWTSNGDGGSAVTGWEYQRKEGSGDWGSWTEVCTTGSAAGCPGKTAHSVMGLTNGTAYRFRVRAVNAVGAGAASPQSDAVTPVEAVESERLARVNETLAPELARAMVSSVVEAVRGRFRPPASGSGEVPAALESAARAMAARQEALAQEEDTVTWRAALAGTTFAHPLAAGGGAGAGAGAGGPTVWGAADYRSLSGGGDRGLPWDGGVGGLHLGLDARFGEGLFGGLALSATEGSFDYTDRIGDGAVRGTWKSSMTSVSPYAAWRPGKGSTVWAMLGRGAGEVELDDEEEGRQVADSELTTAAIGGSVQVGRPGGPSGARPSRLAIEVDAALARFEVEDNADRLEAVEVDTWRLRAALRGEGTLEVGGAGATLMPSAELGVRWDGGDGETGLGLEVGGGLGYAAPGSGLRMDANGRTLLAHGGDVEVWGVDGTVRIEPGAGGRGASFGLGVSWGESGSGVAQLWEEGLRRARSTDSAGGTSMRLDVESGYGMAAPGGGGGLLTPYLGLGLGAGGEERAYRIGARLTHGTASRLGLEGSRRENDTGVPDHALTLEWRMHW